VSIRKIELNKSESFLIIKCNKKYAQYTKALKVSEQIDVNIAYRNKTK